MLLRALLLQSLFCVSLVQAQQTNCVESLSAKERSEIATLKQLMAQTSSQNDPQLRQIISKQLALMSPPARIATLALVSEWNFQILAKELRQKPELAAAFNEFNTAFDQYQKNREHFAGGQWEQKRDNARLTQSQQKLISSLQSSSLPSEHKAALTKAMNLAVAALQSQGAQRLAEGAQFIRGTQAVGMVAGGAVVSAGLIWLSVVTLGAAAPAAGAATAATGTTFLAMVGAGAAGGAGTAGLVGTASIAGNATITANAKQQSFFCTIAQQANVQGPAVVEHALQSAVLGGVLAGGLGLLPAVPGQIVGGGLVLGGTGSAVAIDGLKASDAYRLLKEADQVAARGDLAQARQLYAQSQRLALDAGLDTVATAASVGLALKAALAPKPTFPKVLRGKVVQEVTLEEEITESELVGPKGQMNRLFMDSIPDDLQGALLDFRYSKLSHDELADQIARVMVSHLHSKGVLAELVRVPRDPLWPRVDMKTIIRIVPVKGRGTPHWLNAVAMQMAKSSKDHSLIFDPELALRGTPYLAYYTNMRTTLYPQKYQQHAIALPLRDLSTDKMSDAGLHEWIHYLVAEATYTRGESYQGWMAIRVMVRQPTRYTNVKAKHLADQVPDLYRNAHSVDEIYAHFREAQVVFKNVESSLVKLAQGETNWDLVREIDTLEVCVRRTKAIGEYDLYALNRLLIELTQNKTKFAKDLAFYKRNSYRFALFESADFSFRVPNKLLADHPGDDGERLSYLIQLVEGQISEINKTLSEADIMEELIPKLRESHRISEAQYAEEIVRELQQLDQANWSFSEDF